MLYLTLRRANMLLKVPIQKSNKNLKLRRIKKSIRSKLRNYPFIEVQVRKLWRTFKFSFFKMKWTFEAIPASRRKTRGKTLDANKTYWISPKKVVYQSLQEFNFKQDKGR